MTYPRFISFYISLVCFAHRKPSARGEKRKEQVTVCTLESDMLHLFSDTRFRPRDNRRMPERRAPLEGESDNGEDARSTLVTRRALLKTTNGSANLE